MSDTGQRKSTSVVGFLKDQWIPILAVVISLLFILQNSRRVSIVFLWFYFYPPLWLMLVVILLIGFGAGYLSRRRRSRPERRKK